MLSVHFCHGLINDFEMQKERLKLKNDRLDKQIEFKTKMKEILSDEQYAKWEESMNKRGNRNKRNKRRGNYGKRERNNH